jgi:hypothetical protein
MKDGRSGHGERGFRVAQLFVCALGLYSLQAQEAESVPETAHPETVQAGGFYCSSKGFGAVVQLPKLRVFHANLSPPPPDSFHPFLNPTHSR